MNLAKTILEQLKRLKATIPENATGSSTHLLRHEINWPDAVFTGSVRLMRRRLENEGIDVSDTLDWSDEALRDEMPSLFDFRFLPSESAGKFWEGWENQFPAVDSTKFFPFASDDYYFYFLATNARDNSDPFVFSVDHEETDEEPYDESGLTVSRLLSIIEPANKSV